MLSVWLVQLFYVFISEVYWCCANANIWPVVSRRNRENACSCIFTGYMAVFKPAVALPHLPLVPLLAELWLFNWSLRLCVNDDVEVVARIDVLRLREIVLGRQRIEQCEQKLGVLTDWFLFRAVDLVVFVACVVGIDVLCTHRVQRLVVNLLRNHNLLMNRFLAFGLSRRLNDLAIRFINLFVARQLCFQKLARLGGRIQAVLDVRIILLEDVGRGLFIVLLWELARHVTHIDHRSLWTIRVRARRRKIQWRGLSRPYTVTPKQLSCWVRSIMNSCKSRRFGLLGDFIDHNFWAEHLLLRSNFGLREHVLALPEGAFLLLDMAAGPVSDSWDFLVIKELMEQLHRHCMLLEVRGIHRLLGEMLSREVTD